MHGKVSRENIYFTVNTLSGAGVGDQLGTQFVRLVRLGQALGLRYVHTPPSFPRSQAPSLIRRAVTRAMGVLGSPASSQVADPLTKFLGLDRWKRNITDITMREYTLRSVQLETLLDDDKHVNLSDFREKLRNLVDPTPKCLLCFSWTPALYWKIPIIDSLLKEAGDVPDSEGNLDLAGRYWVRRSDWPVTSVFRREKVRVVVHIRQGDSTVIDIAGRRVCVLGNRVSSDKELEEVLRIDPNRRPIEIGEYRAILNAMETRFGQDRFSGVLISDGYERTFNIIQKARRGGHRALRGISAWDIARSRLSSYRNLNEVLVGFANWSRIIGESEKKLYTSIHALASADIVVWGTGEFAYKVHRLFRKPGARSVTVHVRDGVEKAVEKVACFLK